MHLNDEFVLIEQVDSLTKGDFYIAKLPVTEEKFLHIGNADPNFVSRPGYLYRASWLEAIAYCNRLCEQFNLPPAYCATSGALLDNDGYATQDISSVRGFRLPTPYEWEYAAKGWNGRKDGTYWEVQKKYCRIPYLDYPISEQEIHFFNHGYALVPELTPNVLGIFGMLIYAKEWCDNCQDFPKNPRAACKWSEYFTNYDNDIGYCVNAVACDESAKLPFRVVINKSSVGNLAAADLNF